MDMRQNDQAQRLLKRPTGLYFPESNSLCCIWMTTHGSQAIEGQTGGDL